MSSKAANTEVIFSKLVAEESKRLASAPESSLIVQLDNAIEKLASLQQSPDGGRSTSRALTLIAYGLSPLFSAEAYLGLTPALWKKQQDESIDEAVKGLASEAHKESTDAKKASSGKNDERLKKHVLRAKLGQLFISESVGNDGGASSSSDEEIFQVIDEWVAFGIKTGITFGADDTANKGEGTLLESFGTNARSVGPEIRGIIQNEEIALGFLRIDD